jgi:hypothetical protein
MPTLPDHLRPWTPEPTFMDRFGIAACVLMLVVSGVAATESLIIGLGGVVVLGLGLWVAVVERVNRGPDATAELRPFREHVSRNDVDGYRHLLAAVAPLRAKQAHVALAALAGCPRLLDGLLFHGRRHELAMPPVPANAWSAAMATLHAEGRVREAAIAWIAARPEPGHLMFLMERAVDRAAPVRERALATLAGLLAAHPQIRPSAQEWLPRIAGRRHAAAVAALIVPEPGRLVAPPPEQRHRPASPEHGRPLSEMLRGRAEPVRPAVPVRHAPAPAGRGVTGEG